MKIYFLFAICLLLSSCATHMNKKISYGQSERLKWGVQATANNPEAQFKLGNAYCCGKNGFFVTKTAVDWWCKASRQGHAGARKALAKHNRVQQCTDNPE